MNTALGILDATVSLLNAMSPYLLFGFFFAGLLHIFISSETVATHLGKRGFLSVIKAALFGVPLPLCSCGVIPAAMSLKREGASRGAILSFLISTPTTGVDSIFATYSLLGPVFTVFRVFASFSAGVFAGVMENLLVHHDEPVSSKKEIKCKLCDETGEHSHTALHVVKGIFGYAFGELLEDVGKWLIAGLLLGGVIAYLVPEHFIHQYVGSGWAAMLMMLAIGIPMYVCATGSIPIAAALMMKGMSPGAAFVFLLAGPATNTVTITVVGKNLGKRTLFVYLASIIIISLALGFLLDKLWAFFSLPSIKTIIAHERFLPLWLEQVSSATLLVLILISVLRKKDEAH